MTPDDDERHRSVGKTMLDWFEEGRQARLCQTKRESNPYPADAPGHRAWDQGWAAADDPDDRGKGYS